MSGIFDKVRSSQFVKNVSVLASGTVIVQAISTLISPVLSRLYTPADYGLLAVFVSCVSVLTVVCSFRYELAIILPEKNEDARSLLKLSILILSGFCLLILLATLLFNTKLSSLLGNDRLEGWLYFLAPVVMSAGIIQSLTYWLNRHKNYKTIAGVRVLQSSANSGFSLIFGFLKYSHWGLIVSTIISQIVSALYLLKKTASVFSRTGSSESKTEILSVAKKYKEFPKFNLPAAMLDTISVNSIILILNYFFTETVTGSYSFSLRMLSIPTVVVGASIGQVFYQKISEAYNSKFNITSIIYKTWKLLSLIGLIPVIVIFFWGEQLFPMIFGSDWVQAGEISKYLCLLTFVTFISSPTSSAMLVLKKQKETLIINIITFIYRPLALLYGYYSENFMKGIMLYIALEIIQIGFYNFIMIRASRQSDNNRSAAEHA